MKPTYEVTIFDNGEGNFLGLENKLLNYFDKKKASDPSLGIYGEINHFLRNSLTVYYLPPIRDGECIRFGVEGDFERIKHSLEQLGQKYNGLIVATKLLHYPTANEDKNFPEVYVIYGGTVKEKLPIGIKRLSEHPINPFIVEIDGAINLPEKVLFAKGDALFGLGKRVQK